MDIAHFRNLRAITSRPERRVRQTVACIHVPASIATYERTTPVGLQLPKKVRNLGGRNFSSLQGEIDPDEAPTQALIREAKEEYQLERSDIRQIEYLVSTKIPVSQDSSKAKDWDAQWLHWFGLRTRRNFKPNADQVAQFAWCSGPDQLFDTLFEVRIEKLMAFSVAVAHAISANWLPIDYRPMAELTRSSSAQAA